MSRRPIYRPRDADREAQFPLISLLSVCEHELASLEALADTRLSTIIETMQRFHQDLLDAIAAMEPESESAT